MHKLPELNTVGNKIPNRQAICDTLMEAALEAGADDVVTYDDSFEVLCAPDVFNEVSAGLAAAARPQPKAINARINRFIYFLLVA